MNTRSSAPASAIVPIVAVATLALGTWLAGPAHAQDTVRETRTYDVSDLAPEDAAPMRPSLWDAGLFHTVSSHFIPSEAMSELGEMSVAQHFSASELSSLLSSIVYDVDEDASVDDVDRRIRVHASAEGQRLAEAALEHLRRAAGEPVRIQVEELVLPLDVEVVEQPDAGTLADWRQRDVRGAGRVLGLSLEPACWRLAEDTRGVRCVIDVDVEIAQDSAIADPVVMRVDTGARLIARALPLFDGRVALRVCMGAADLRGEPRRVSFGQDELGSVDLADLEAGFVSTELLLTAGEAQTVVLLRPGGERRVMVFRLLESPVRAMEGTLRLFPFAALAVSESPLRLTIGDAPWLDGRPAFSIAEADDGSEAWRLPEDQVRERLEAAIVPELDEGTAEISTLDWMLGGSYAVRATEEALDRVAARLQALEAEVMQHARLDIQLVERPLGGGASRVIGRLQSPVPMGVPVALAAYRNAAYVADQDVEVAEKSRISDPIVSSVLAGALANVTVSRSGSRSFSVALEMRVAEFAGPELHPFAATDVGAVERVVDRALYTESRIRVSRARPGELVLGQSPFTGEPAWIVAVVTVK